MPTTTTSRQMHCQECQRTVRVEVTHTVEKNAGGQSAIDFKSGKCENGHDVDVA